MNNAFLSEVFKALICKAFGQKTDTDFSLAECLEIYGSLRVAEGSLCTEQEEAAREPEDTPAVLSTEETEPEPELPKPEAERTADKKDGMSDKEKEKQNRLFKQETCARLKRFKKALGAAAWPMITELDGSFDGATLRDMMNAGKYDVRIWKKLNTILDRVFPKEVEEA